MKKMTLMLMGVFTVLKTYSQVDIPFEVVIANGGQFETSAPYNDRATVGVYNIDNGSYTVIDTLQAEGVADVDALMQYLGNYHIVVAAQDSLYLYDYYNRIAQAYFPGVRSVKIARDNNYIIAGKWFGAGDYVTLYDQSDLTPIFSITDADIPYTVHDAEIIGDSLYVAYNIPGTIDYCPPWGCYEDTIGMIGVVSINSQQLERTISLDTAGAGIIGLTSDNGHLFAACEVSGNIIKYDLSIEDTTIYPVGMTKYIGYEIESNFIEPYISFIAGGEVKVMPATGGVNSTGIPAGFHDAYGYDFVGDHLYYTTTDWATYGKFYKRNSTSILDSVNVAIAPDAIDIVYDKAWGIEDNELDVRLYPNPSNGTFRVLANSIQRYEIWSLDGKFINAKDVNSSNVTISSDLPSGIYFIRIITESGNATRKISIY